MKLEMVNRVSGREQNHKDQSLIFGTAHKQNQASEQQNNRQNFTSIMQRKKVPGNSIADVTVRHMGYLTYLGKATVSTIPKSCRSKSRLCLLASMTILWPIPTCIADISSEVGFCWVQSQRKRNETFAVMKYATKNDYFKRTHLGKKMVSTMWKSSYRTSRFGFGDSFPILCWMPSWMVAISSEVVV